MGNANGNINKCIDCEKDLWNKRIDAKRCDNCLVIYRKKKAKEATYKKRNKIKQEKDHKKEIGTKEKVLEDLKTIYLEEENPPENSYLSSFIPKSTYLYDMCFNDPKSKKILAEGNVSEIKKFIDGIKKKTEEEIEKRANEKAKEKQIIEKDKRFIPFGAYP